MLPGRVQIHGRVAGHPVVADADLEAGAGLREGHLQQRVEVLGERRVHEDASALHAEPVADAPNRKVKFEIYGEEMLEKRVKSSGNSGRVYLPPNWVGHKVKIIRTN